MADGAILQQFFPRDAFPSYDYHEYSGIQFVCGTDLSDYVTTVGTDVSEWKDERDTPQIPFTQTVSANRPSFANGYIESGLGDFLNYVSGSLALTDFSFVVVAYQNALQDVEVFGHSASIDRLRLRNVATVAQLTIGGVNDNITVVGDAWNLIGVRRTGTTAEWRVNGGAWTPITTSGVTWTLDEFFGDNVSVRAVMFQNIQESQANLNAVFTSWNTRYSVY